MNVGRQGTIADAAALARRRSVLALAVRRRRRGSGQAGGRLGRLVKKGGRRCDSRCTVWLHNISARSPSCGDTRAPPDSPNADLPASRTPRPGLRRSCLVGGLFSLLHGNVDLASQPPWRSILFLSPVPVPIDAVLGLCQIVHGRRT